MVTRNDLWCGVPEAVALAAVVLGTISLVGMVLLSLGISDRFFASPYVLGTAWVALKCGRHCGLMTALAAYLIWDGPMMPPYWALSWPDANNMTVAATLIATAWLVGGHAKPKAKPQDDARYIGSLPFTTRDEDDARRFWCVESSGDWVEDCEVGQEYARLYLDRVDRDAAPLLGWIVADMMRQDRPISGVEIGFCAGLMNRLRRPSVPNDHADNPHRHGAIGQAHR